MTRSILLGIALLLAQPAFSTEPPGSFSWDRLALGEKKRVEAWQGVTKSTAGRPAYNYFLPTGFTWNARLQNKLYSYATQSPVILVTERDIVYLDRIVIPAGSRVIGSALVDQNGDRILVELGVMVFPTGDEVPFSGMALSLDGSIGLPGKVETEKGGAVATSVLRAVIGGTQTALEVAAGNPVTAQAAQGVSQEALREIDAARQRVVTKSITVEAEAPALVYLNRRLEY